LDVDLHLEPNERPLTGVYRSLDQMVDADGYGSGA